MLRKKKKGLRDGIRSYDVEAKARYWRVKSCGGEQGNSDVDELAKTAAVQCMTLLDSHITTTPFHFSSVSNYFLLSHACRV